MSTQDQTTQDHEDASTQATSRRQRAATREHHVGETWRLETANDAITGLVQAEKLLSDGTAEWTLYVGDDETRSVSWDAVDAAEQITPKCSVCATAGHAVCYQHGGGEDE